MDHETDTTRGAPFTLRLLAGSSNVARYGGPVGTYVDAAEAIAAGYRELLDAGLLSPGDAGVRGFLVEERDGKVVAEH